jgi:hypothetical protein
VQLGIGDPARRLGALNRRQVEFVPADRGRDPGEQLVGSPSREAPRKASLELGPGDDRIERADFADNTNIRSISPDPLSRSFVCRSLSGILDIYLCISIEIVQAAKLPRIGSERLASH